MVKMSGEGPWMQHDWMAAHIRCRIIAAVAGDLVGTFGRVVALKKKVSVHFLDVTIYGTHRRHLANCLRGVLNKPRRALLLE